MSEFVVVIERWATPSGIGLVTPTDRHYVGISTAKRVRWGTVTVQRGNWDIDRSSSMAFMFPTLKEARRVARSARIIQAAQKHNYRVAVRIAWRRPGRRFFEIDAFGKNFLGPEMWPELKDPVAALAVIE